MKQGHASSNPHVGKTEPHSKGVNPGGVDQLGAKVAVVRAYEPLYEGRGYRAPMAGHTIHPHGSQGRHK